MKELVGYIAKKLCTHPGEVQTFCSHERDASYITLKVHPDDLYFFDKRRNPTIVRALNNLLTVAGIKKGHRYYLRGPESLQSAP